MADDIAANGLRHRIILDPEGRVLDGRQRLAACQLAGVEPTFQVVDDDPFAVIFSMNALRQNVTTGQEAMSVALMLALDGKRRNGRWVRGSVETDGLDNAKSVTKRGRARQVAMVKAGAVLNYAPNLAKDVAWGRLSLDAAYQRAEENRAAAERVAALDPDLAVLVKAGSITLAEAERRIRDGKRLEQLPADLAQRVEEGNVSLDEAEVLHKQEQVRSRCRPTSSAPSLTQRHAWSAVRSPTTWLSLSASREPVGCN